MSVLVCVPTTGDIRSETAEVALAICANHTGGASSRTVRAHPTDRCRNLCVREFLQSPHSHLLFLDSDVVPPVDSLVLMLRVGRPVVCGIYPLLIENVLCTSVARKLAPNTYGFLHDFPDELFEIDAAGMGCCLIAREVLQQIKDPWFKFEVRPDGHMTGEDIYVLRTLCGGWNPSDRGSPDIVRPSSHSGSARSIPGSPRAASRAKVTASGVRVQHLKVGRSPGAFFVALLLHKPHAVDRRKMIGDTLPRIALVLGHP